jgi:hypothetical protein
MSPEDSTLSEDQFSGRDNEGEGSDEDDVEYVEDTPQSTPPQRTPRRTPARAPRRVPQRSPQSTPRKVVPQGTPQKTTGTSPATQRTSPPVKRVPSPSHPTNPYKEGTKKFLVAQKFLSGEKDRKKVAREVGVSTHTIYTVSSDLRLHGYTLKVDIKTPQPVVSHVSHVSSPAPQESPQGDIAGISSGDAPQESPSAGIWKGRRNTSLGMFPRVMYLPRGPLGDLPREVPENQVSPERT